LVWYDALDNLQQAGQITQLQILFNDHKPSAIVNPFSPEEPPFNNWVLVLISFLVILTITIGFFVYQNKKQVEIQKQIDELNAKMNQNFPIDTFPYKTKPAIIELE